MTSNSSTTQQKSHERNTFLFICIVMAPLLSIILVGGYGLIIWISQMIFGPPSI